MIGRQYSIQQSIAAVTTAKILLQIKAGATTPLWINYVACDGSSDTADGMDITLVRASSASTVTSLTPSPFGATAGTVQIAQAAGGTSATGHTSTSDGTLTDVLWRRQASVQSGGGCAEWFPEGAIVVNAAGFIVLKSNITITSATLTCTIIFTEIG